MLRNTNNFLNLYPWRHMARTLDQTCFFNVPNVREALWANLMLSNYLSTYFFLNVSNVREALHSFFSICLLTYFANQTKYGKNSDLLRKGIIHIYWLKSSTIHALYLNLSTKVMGLGPQSSQWTFQKDHLIYLMNYKGVVYFACRFDSYHKWTNPYYCSKLEWNHCYLNRTQWPHVVGQAFGAKC